MTNLRGTPKITDFPNLSGIEIAIWRVQKEVQAYLQKDEKFSYFNLFFKAYIKITTESSKIVGPGTCQTRAIFCLIQIRFLRNIFCSDLSLLRCEYDYVINMT